MRIHQHELLNLCAMNSVLTAPPHTFLCSRVCCCLSERVSLASGLSFASDGWSLCRFIRSWMVDNACTTINKKSCVLATFLVDFLDLCYSCTSNRNSIDPKYHTIHILRVAVSAIIYNRLFVTLEMITKSAKIKTCKTSRYNEQLRLAGYGYHVATAAVISDYFCLQRKSGIGFSSCK